MSKSGTNKKKRGAPNTPLRRSTRRAPPIRHLPGMFTSLFTTTKKNSNNRRLTVLNEEPFVYSIKNFLTKAEIEYMKNVELGNLLAEKIAASDIEDSSIVVDILRNSAARELTLLNNTRQP